MDVRRLRAKPNGIRRWSRVSALVLLVLAGALGLAVSYASEHRGIAILLKLHGAVSPATADYITRGLERAQEQEADLIILQLDTPGGLDTSMRDIIRAILASPVPVASYVAPSGARAASAGTYILYASHIAAMASGTNLGAATPVSIGGGGLPFGGEETEEQSDEEVEAGSGEAAGEQKFPENASEAKAINDAVAYIRGLAELRDRNADWAEEAVRQAASLPATAAAQENVIDFVATSVDKLLEKADGRTVRLGQATVTIDTSNLAVEEVEPDWRTRLLAVITNPNVALILMMIGVYGLIFEFLSPGALVPGTVGAISLLLGLYALAVFPVNYAGAGLMVLGIGLIVAEAFAPSFGILGIGGTVALVLGATILFDADVPGLQLSWSVVGGVAVASLALTLLIVWLAWTSQRRSVVTGAQQLIGATGAVRDWSGTEGHVHIHGERWNAVSSQSIMPGQEVRVTGLKGLTLEVAALDAHDVKQPFER